MRALTLQRPWPWAIIYYGKRIENRTWRPSPKQLEHGDWFAIHAGAGWDEAGERYLLRLLDSPDRPNEWPGLPNKPSHDMGIVAVARFGGVVTFGWDTMFPEQRPWYFGPIGWKLLDVRAVDAIPCSGKQGLWNVPDDIAARIAEQVPEVRKNGS